jgi:DNA-binding transcriptional LysR family regulator
VAGQGGFGRAERSSGRPKATLSRKVAQLEQDLGVRLIERGTHSLRLTEEGVMLYARAEGLLAEIAEAGEAVALGASIPRGRLRVSAPIVFAHVALGGIAARFALAYPEVQLEIVAEDRVVDPVEEGYDLVIRIDPAPDDRLVGRKILNDERLVVAAPRTPAPPTSTGGAGDIPVKAVVLASMPRGRLWKMRPLNGAPVVLRPEPILRLSSLLMVRDATMAGAGVALLPRLLVEADVASGRLVQWGTEDGPAVQIWALQSSRRLIGAKVRAFLDTMDRSFPGRVFPRQG